MWLLPRWSVSRRLFCGRWVWLSAEGRWPEPGCYPVGIPCNVVINPGDTDLSDNGVQVSHDCLLLGVWVTLYIPVQGGLASSSRVLKKKAHAHTKPRKTLHLGQGALPPALPDRGGSTPTRTQSPAVFMSCAKLSALPSRHPTPPTTDTRKLADVLGPFLSQPGSMRGQICPFAPPACGASSTAPLATLRAPALSPHRPAKPGAAPASS